jgi:GMP synthase (glutamine-hydrolysing)
MPNLRLLVAESEPPSARETRRASVGTSQGETYLQTLARLAPGARTDLVRPVDGELPGVEALRDFDAVFLTGSPVHLQDDTPEVARLIDFMRTVFDSGVPSFGSCAGLQLAVVTAGGELRRMGDRREAGFSRGIAPTASGRDHPLLAGRPAAFDAPAIYTDEVIRLPEGALALAANNVSPVLAAEVRHGRGIFWGVQYHPELSLFEVAAAIRRQSDDLLERGFASDEAALEAHAARIEALGDQPDRHDLAWQLGLDAEITDPARRARELSNFITHVADRVEGGRVAV